VYPSGYSQANLFVLRHLTPVHFPQIKIYAFFMPPAVFATRFLYAAA
jgi:hypothetical protein